MPYRDLREYLAVLAEHGKLVRVQKEVDKDWEIAAVCRVLLTDIPEAERPALLFERIKGYDAPVAAGILGASRAIYALAMETDVDGIMAKWRHARSHPIDPVLVSSGPCQEHVHVGEQADLTRFPWPTWTVEHDAGPYITCGYVVTKDVRSGCRNVGTYRQQVKGPRKTGMGLAVNKDAYRHIRRNEEINVATPVAIVVGADPAVGLCSVTNFPPEVDEYAIAGGLRGAPVELVKCRSIDLEVPATAEFVIEGEIRCKVREEEGPFGEYTGYMSGKGQKYVVDIKAITHRHQPILQAFISQMPPSESSTIRGVAHDQSLLFHLRDVMKLPVTDVHCLAAGGTDAFIVAAIDKKRGVPGVARQVVFAIWSYEARQGKITVVVDDDIDVRNEFMINWALSFRMQPARDVFVITDTAALHLDPSVAPPGTPTHDLSRFTGSRIGIDATRKFEFPPMAVPPKEHLAMVKGQWAEYGIAAAGRNYQEQPRAAMFQTTST